MSLPRRMVPIESGLLAVFRLLIALRFGLLWLGLCLWLADPAQRTLRLPLPGLIETSFLLLYLSSSWLRDRLGEVYLPVALIVASTGPFISFMVNVTIRISHGITGSQLTDDVWTIFIILFVPLLIISWQYRFRAVILFCIGTTVFESVLAVAVAGVFDLPVRDALGMIFALAFVRTVMYLVVGYTVVRLMSAQRQQRDALAEANARLADHAATREQLAISEERSRLAREMHDTLAHSLSAVAVQMEAVKALWDTDSERAREMLNQSLETARAGLGEARRAIRDLRSSPLEEMGLAGAVCVKAHATAEACGLELSIDTPANLPSYPLRIEQGVYRIAEEALNNIRRHAYGATCLHVSLQADSSRLTLEIADNGPGLDPFQTQQSGHFGLRGMEERAAMIGGMLTVNGGPGEGTSIVLRLGVDATQTESNGRTA